MPSWRDEYKAFNAGGAAFLPDGEESNNGALVFTNSFNVSMKDSRVRKFAASKGSAGMCVFYVDVY
jgi:hypothetical protein